MEAINSEKSEFTQAIADWWVAVAQSVPENDIGMSEVARLRIEIMRQVLVADGSSSLAPKDLVLVITSDSPHNHILSQAARFAGVEVVWPSNHYLVMTPFGPFVSAGLYAPYTPL